MIARVYQALAERTIESLLADRLDLDRFLPALHREMGDQARQIAESADDYETSDLNWAADQAREAKLLMEGLADAIAEMECAIGQSIPSDDRIIIGHMKSAAATLRNLERRIDAT
jgi:hypothetical protein